MPTSLHDLTECSKNRQLRVLIVEDDAMIGLLLGEMFEEIGHEVCAIESTEVGAIASAARYSPDIMVVDAQLREGSGISAVDHIISHKFIPHVFVSGDVRGILRVRPAAVAIAKPFTVASLVKAIARAQRVC